MDRVMPGNRDHPNPIGHDHVLALAGDPKPGFLQRANSIPVVDAWQLRHA